MKTIKLFTAMSLFILATVMISSSTFAQKAKMKTFMYYVKVHLSSKQSADIQYSVEIWDQYGWRVLAPKKSVSGQYIYVFQETVPVSVTKFNRIARVILLPNQSRSDHLFWASPEMKTIINPGNYYFDIYPVDTEISTLERKKKD